MKKNKCIIYLILIIIAIIFLGGVIVHFSKPLCDCDDEKVLSMRCNSLSESNKTCYPDDNLHSGYKRCSEGWKLHSNNRWFK